MPTTSISLAVTEELSKLWKETIITTFRNEACSLDLARTKAALIMECFVARLMDRLEVLGGTERQRSACRNVDAVFYSFLRLGSHFSTQGMRNTNWKEKCKNIWKLMQDACKEVKDALPCPGEVVSLLAEDINSPDIKKVRDHLLSYFEQEELSSGPIHRVGDMVRIKDAKHSTLWRICALSGDVASDNRQWQADLVSQDHRNVDAKPGMDPGYTWEIESGMSATVVAVDEQSCSCSVSLKTHIVEDLLCCVETPLPGPPPSPVFGLGHQVSLVTDPTKSHRILRVREWACITTELCADNVQVNWSREGVFYVLQGVDEPVAEARLCARSYCDSLLTTTLTNVCKVSEGVHLWWC